MGIYYTLGFFSILMDICPVISFVINEFIYIQIIQAIVEYNHCKFSPGDMS